MKYIQSRLLASAIFILSMVLPGVVWAESEYQLTVLASPTIAGSFNKSSATLEVGKTIQLVAYANSNFTFVQWTDESGAVVSKQMDFVYTMPSHNSTLTAEYEYNPANPANPVRNYWNKQTGEVIVDDFTTGQLQSAVKTAIDNGKASEVSMITVAGVMNTNDFGILNTYSSCTLLDLSRVAGVTQVPSYAFDNTNLESVYLPTSIEGIGNQAFYGCKQLTSMIIYAITPPALGSNVFTNVPDGLVVYVPASAISLYQNAAGWKNLTILPIQEDIRRISVSLPDGTRVADYTNMWLELTNTKSGQRMHYVMTDRETYTFTNIIRNTSWNVTLRNERGDIFGQIDNVEVKDEDVIVTFTSLLKPQSVVLSVFTPDGQDVTAQTQVTWMDAQGNYLAQGVSLSGMPTGYQASYRVVLSQDLAMSYETPRQMDYVLTDGNNNITCQLNAIPQVKITGKVKDASTGLPLSGAVVSASQTFGGKYSKTLNAKTDGNGAFTLDIANVPTSVTFAASDYISQTVNCNSLLTGVEDFTLPDISLKSITGATITLSFTYTSCDGETQNWYSDYQNVNYELFNVTKNKAVSQYNVQYPQIVLLEDIADGDVLRLSTSSRTNAFMPVTTTTTIEEQKAQATFAIVELGKIQSSFTSTGNAAVVGSLYDGTGKLMKTYNYSEASLTINDLADGNYTLVSMGNSRLFNTIYDLSQLPQTGLIEDVDYVQNSVEVKSGQVSAISISEVPTLDESKLYYTGDNTSFTVNKPSIVAGNYLTLTGRIDFKPAYATSISNVQMVVDLPESCQFVENSVMVGNSTSSYTLNGNRITIPMIRYTDRVRFCIIPTLGGEYAPSAFVQFDIDGETVTQPIGSANYTAKDLSISVPSTVAKTTVPISGTAIGTSQVEIYDNDVLISQTTSLANGTWATTCELNEPYNLSTHSIYARVITKNRVELQSETKNCLFDKNAIEVKTVTMINTAHGPNNLTLKDYVTVFDFQNPKESTSPYWYWPSYPDFTFLVDFTNNDTTVVSNVMVHVKLSNKTISHFSTVYDSTKKLWIASNKFYPNALPTNVSVTYTSLSNSYIERHDIDIKTQNIDNMVVFYDNLTEELNDSLNSIEKNEQETENLMSRLEYISDALNLTNDEQEEKELWKQYFALLGHEEIVDSMEADVVKIITPEYQQTLIERIDSLLNIEIDEPDEHELNELIKQTEYLLNDNNDPIDYLSSIATLQTTEYIWEENGVERKMYKLPLSEFDTTIFDETDMATMAVSDGSKLIIGANSKTIAWIDTGNNSVWILESSDIASEVRSSMRRAQNDKNTLLDLIKQINWCYERFMNGATPWINNVKKQHEALQLEIDKWRYYTTEKYISASKIEKEIACIEKELNNMRRSVPSVEEMFTSRQAQLKTKLGLLRKSYQRCNKEALDAIAKQGKLKIKLARVGAVLGTITDVISIVRNAVQLVNQIREGIQDWNMWSDFIEHILPCDASKNQAEAIKAASETDRAWIITKYIGCGAATLGAIGATAYLMTNKGAGTVIKETLKHLGIGALSDLLSRYSDKFFKSIKKDSSQKRMKLKEERSKLVCGKNNGYDEYDDFEENGNGKNDGNSGSVDVKFVQDPSGYIYEGVTSNRLEGVTATVYYKEMVEDMYGDLHENVVKWDASEYAQENPLFTDEYGFYQWDVPQGLWQVKFEKEGYETTYSEWLPVPPPQLDVNIAMKQNVLPSVKQARAYEDAVEVEFDKYMMPELLTAENIMVIAPSNSPEGGEVPLNGTIELLNEEASYEGSTETFASKIRFNAAQPFTEQEVTLIVSNRVKSYAGIRMQDDFSQTFKVEQEIKQILCDSMTVVNYGGKSTLTVFILPASASKGKTLTVKTSSPMILGVETEQVIIGEDGKAEITVSGELPGTAALTFFVEGTDKTALTIANVEQKVYTFVATPIANIASGSVVDTGTQITLSCETDGVTIYYTIDGSCPCDNASRIKYDGTPIIINEGVTIKVIAVAPNGTESDVAEFMYTTKDEEDAIFQIPATTITNTKDEYDISGRKVGRKTKGIIIRNNNGTNRKVLVK